MSPKYNEFFSGSSVFPEVITDHLEAATANIKHLKVNHPIQTPRGDVAYHFKLKDCPKNIQLEEGDLIGFFENPHDGKSEIRRLTCDNARYAKLAGVISRSAWLEGKTPGDDDKGKQSLLSQGKKRQIKQYLTHGCCEATSVSLCGYLSVGQLNNGK